MNQKTIILLAVLILAGAGIFLFRGDSEDTVTNNSAMTSNTETDADPLLPSSLFGGSSYIATISITDSAQPENNGSIVFAFESPTLWSSTISSPEGEIQTVYSEQGTFVNNGGMWIKYPSGSPTADLNYEDIGFSDSEFNDIRDSATYKGTESCSLGSCSVWEAVEPGEAGGMSTLYIGSNGRIARVMGTDGTTSTDIQYDYDTAPNVAVPTDYEEFSIPGL